MKKHLVIATRGSRLALWQANAVKDSVRKLYPDLEVSLEVIKTSGDIIQDVPLADIGGKGLFVKEIEEALLDGRADLAVHSIKDVPMSLPEGLVMACVPEREDCRDVFLSVRYPGVEDLPQGALVGTSSLRRQAQLLALRPDLRVEPLRGNVDTRLRKLHEGVYDAVVLAAAALNRLNLSAPSMRFFDTERFLPAVGQGALGIECRADDSELVRALQKLEDRVTRLCVEAERGLLAGLEGGCQAPIAGHARPLDENTLYLEGLVSYTDGSRMLRREKTGSAAAPRELGLRLAENLLENGAREILAQLFTGAR
ncbi:MAG: hydroxymethylbilane synthase [Desulfovibrio sp.]|jgi:hydroxymethylbilane synthase|nr:hydroxymethylbilane synthase [Desulfovibrio sp.]